MTDLDLEALERLAALPDTPAPAPTPPASLTQRVTVTLETGEVWDVTLDGRDRRAYALAQDRYQLPAINLDPSGGVVDALKLELLTVFSAWHATRHRLGLHGLDWPRFNGLLIDLAIHPDAPEVAPHPPEPGGA